MTRTEAFAEINQIQDSYVDELISIINNPNYAAMKTINFTSPTGTGKTKMMSKLINKFPDYYFIITTLSKGQLHLQIRESLQKDCNQNNFYVYGSADYKINSKLDANDIIGKIPVNTKCIWLRDEGHIKTNRFDALLQNVCYKVVNFSATNMHSDIQCNFAQTMMLRTVNQTNGTPEDAIEKLLEVKEVHKNVASYNPCAIFRCVGGDNALYEQVVDLCEEHDLKYIDITENTFNMAELCEDDNEYDVIINKFKIVEGIDIRRAHVLYMDNQPASNATTIQVIGRCRRNALLYRNDIDILAPENSELLKATRECYVYYNVKNMKIDSDADGELCYAFCDKISCESLKAGMTIHVENGQLFNGLYVLELQGCTGDFAINVDPNTGFNVVSPITSFYDTVEKRFNEYLYIPDWNINDERTQDGHYVKHYSKIHIDDVPRLLLNDAKNTYDYGLGQMAEASCEPYYYISKCEHVYNHMFPDSVSDVILNRFDDKMIKYQSPKLKNVFFSDIRIEDILNHQIQVPRNKTINKYIQTRKNKSEWSKRLQDEFLKFDSYEIENITSDSYSLVTMNDLMDDESKQYLFYICLQRMDNAVFWNIFDSRQLHEQVETICRLILVMNAAKNTKLCKAIIYHVLNDNIKCHICTTRNDIVYYFHKYVNIQVCKMKRGILGEPVPMNDVKVKAMHVDAYFASIKELCRHISVLGLSMVEIVEIINECMLQTRERLQQNIIDDAYLSYDSLFESASQEETEALNNGELPITHHISKYAFNQYVAYRHDKIINDAESAIVGVDMMRPIKIDNTMIWTESKAITSKVGGYNKLNEFLSSKYSDEITCAKSQCFNGKNNFKLDKKCNTVLGYCVEYYSKYVVYGESYLEGYIDRALRESKMESVNSSIIVRACMLKYRDMMIRSFGGAMSKIIRTMSITTLLQEKYEYFVNLVVALGTQTAKYVMNTLYADRDALDNVDPNLSIRHICGLADYITTDTILDVKVRNNIDDKCISQVLGYHYLSTKRSDLFIKKVIIYDAVSNKSIVIDITDKNLKEGHDYGKIES